MELQKSATEQFGVVQANGMSVLVDHLVYPVHYEYLCYTFKPGSRIKGEIRIEPNIVAGCSAIAPIHGLVTIQSIVKGLAYFKNSDNYCEVRNMIPLSAPILVFIPQILIM